MLAPSGKLRVNARLKSASGAPPKIDIINAAASKMNGAIADHAVGDASRPPVYEESTY